MGNTKRVACFSDIEEGAVVEPFKNSNGHHYSIGEHYEVANIDCSDHTFTARSLKTGKKKNWLEAIDCYLISNSYSKEYFQEKKEKLQKDIEDIDAKIKFMDEHGLEEFDEEQYRIYRSLDILEDDSKSKKEKSEVLRDLIYSNGDKDCGC